MTRPSSPPDTADTGLHVHNTRSRRLEAFRPIHAGRVGMYVCGMTVYDHCHLGHARVLVVFDMIRRWLRASGYQVTYVRNVTDIDDKIIARARESGEDITTLTDRFITAMHEDASRLGVEAPDFEPRATEHIPDMVRIIGELEQRGLAYPTAGGDVCFAVRDFPGYGALSGKSLDDLRAGERVAVQDDKRDPFDFVLWKRARPGEPAWDSPWGPGRPGWHIECSAMSARLLGALFDIHGGGQDLIFPHHENEIAQSEGACGHRHVNYWLHNGFVQVDDEKMSKSLGNFFTVREILARHAPESVRFFILRSHYRRPLNYGEDSLLDAHAGLSRLYTAIDGPLIEPDVMAPLAVSAPAPEEPWVTRFRAAMNDDFNTPEALAVLFDLATEVNRSQDARLRGCLRALGGVLGLLGQDARTFLRAGSAGQGPEVEEAWVDEQIEARRQARQARDFARADAIRDALAAAGVLLEDGPGGTTWRRG